MRLRPMHRAPRLMAARGFAVSVTLALAAALPQGAVAQSVPPAYSAEALYIAPDGSRSSGVVVKSGPDMRLEYLQGDRPVVQIIRRAEGVMYMLDPAARTWFEVRGTPDPNAALQGYSPPCEQDASGMTCRFIGNEVTSGITAEVWEIGQPGQAQPLRILWDGARHRALRQDYPDGTVMAMAFVAMEQVAGRNAEHWRITLTTPGQQPVVGNWYYDPELRVELREELPTGEVRALENLAIGGVDPAAFTVPDGWTQVQPPQAPAPAPAPN